MPHRPICLWEITVITVNKLFTAGQIKNAESAVQGVIDDTISNFDDATSLDYVAAFAGPVPLRIIADRLGIPEQDRAFFDDAAAAAASHRCSGPARPGLSSRRPAVNSTTARPSGVCTGVLRRALRA